MDPEKLNTIWEWPPPNDKHELRSFLGLCTYCWRLMARFSDITKSLTQLVGV
jgi:hypothetical protein